MSNTGNTEQEAVALSHLSGELGALLPCPFCGGQAEIDTARSYRNFRTGRMADEVAIYCNGCPADMALCKEDVQDLDTEGIVYALTEAWNKRQPSA